LKKVKERMQPIAEAFAKTGRSDGTIQDNGLFAQAPFICMYSDAHKKEYPNYDSFYQAFVVGVAAVGIVAKTPGPRPDEMICQVAMILYKDGMLEMHVQYWFNAIIWPRDVPYFDLHIYDIARIGSAQQERMIDILMNELLHKLRPALECFAGFLETLDTSV
jgi:hypothetical protein